MLIFIGIILAIYVFMFALIRSADIADRRMEEIQRRSAAREAGTAYGN